MGPTRRVPGPGSHISDMPWKKGFKQLTCYCLRTHRLVFKQHKIFLKIVFLPRVKFYSLKTLHVGRSLKKRRNISSTNEDFETAPTQSHERSKLKGYTRKFKLKAVKYAEVNSNHAATRKFGVDVRRIREW